MTSKWWFLTYAFIESSDVKPHILLNYKGIKIYMPRKFRLIEAMLLYFVLFINKSMLIKSTTDRP